MILRAFAALEQDIDLGALYQSQKGDVVRQFIWSKWTEMSGDETDLGNRTIDTHYKEWMAEKEIRENNLENK
jgi:hypothetical protein